MSKIVLLNGPKACGKNVAVDAIKAFSMREVVDRRCKDHLFTLTAMFFRMTLEEFHVMYEDRATKESSRIEFMVTIDAYNKLCKVINTIRIEDWERHLFHEGVRLSVREALIYVSEIVCKPTFGQDYFGIARAESIEDDELSIDDSCGFDDEIAPTLEKLGPHNVLLIRISGRGTFENDSRSFIRDGVVDNTVDIWNTGTEQEFIKKISSAALEFFRGGS